MFEEQLEEMEISDATPNLDTDTTVRLLVPTPFLKTALFDGSTGVHYLMVVCWAHEAGMPFCLATKQQQDPVDCYPSCINRHLGVKECGKYWENLKPISLITL